MAKAEVFNKFDLDGNDEYPLFSREPDHLYERDSFFEIDIRDGSISARYQEGEQMSLDEFNELVIQFSCSNLIHKQEINDFISNNLHKFQAVFDCYELFSEGENVMGKLKDGCDYSAVYDLRDDISRLPKENESHYFIYDSLSAKELANNSGKTFNNKEDVVTFVHSAKLINNVNIKVVIQELIDYLL